MVYQVTATIHKYRARVWIDRLGRKVPTFYDTTPERAALVKKCLPAGGVLNHYVGGWSWVLPNFGRD